MNWNTRPENATKPSQFSKTQSSILQQFLLTSTNSQSSFGYPAHNQEACMYSSNSNSDSQPLPSGRNYVTPQTQIPVSNMPSRTVVASQSSVERVVCTNVKGPQQPNHNLQTVSSGVLRNVWLGSSVNLMPSLTEATISHNPGGGTNTPYMHPPQSQLVTSDTYSMHLQMVPLDSGKIRITYQGNQGLNHFMPDQLTDWTQYTSNELSYSEHRPPLKQYTRILPATTPLQVKNNQLPTYTQALQTKHSASLSSHQYAAETSKRLSSLPYSCRYGNQHVQNAQPISKPLPMEVPQSSELHSSENKKDYRGFKQQWQNTNEIVNLGKFCELKINNKQSYGESVRSSGDGVQALVQNNQEKRKYFYNPSTNQEIDTNATKEKLARDIKSLVEIKRKFSELARKIKINKSLLMAAGCSKTANTSYTEPIQHSELSAKEMSAKNGNDCSMELLATCLSLWKNQPPKTTEENVPNPLEEKQCNTARVSTTVVGSSNPMNEVNVTSFCSGVGNSQKMMNSSQTVLSVLTPSGESSGVAVGKGTELQIAVVSPLVLSDTNTLPGKELVPEVLPETVYPVVKEGSVCSLQNQQAETVALPLDIIGAVAGSNLSAEVSLPIHKDNQQKPTQGNSDIADNSLGKHSPLSNEALPNPMDSAIESGPMLQIESICSLAEGDVSYNSQIAEIFNSVQNEPQKSSPNQSTNSQQEQVDNTTENKDLSFQKNKCVQSTDVPHKVTEQPEPLQPEEPTSCDYVEANTATIEGSSGECTGGKENTPKDKCLPAAFQQDPHSLETNMVSKKSSYSLPAVNEINDESESISYLQDQLSELLKEFPYGIETANRHEVFVGQQKTHKILENETGVKTSKVSADSTDQIKITVLNSEQIKELFPEEEQLCDLDKLAEPENKKVAEVKSPCESQVPREESHDIGMLGPEEDKIHCCALGWLSMVYEGVPQCQCGSTEEKGKDQCVDTNGCKQGEQPCNNGVTIFEINPVSNNPNTPQTQAAKKGHFSEMHDEKTKTSKAKDSREEQELTCHFSAKCYKIDKKGSFKIRHGSSLKMEQNLKNISSKSDRSNPLKRSKIANPDILHVVTSNSDKRMTFFKQASQEDLQKNNTSQDSNPAKAPVECNTDSCRENASSVQSVSSEKKKLKFKAGSSRLKYFEKRKTDHISIPDVKIKKKRYEKQEQNKNAGDILKSYSTLTESNERAIVQEKTVPSPESSDSKGSSSKSTRVITVQEYLQRQKDKHVNISKNICVENAQCDSEHIKTAKQSVAGSLGKLTEGQDINAETSKEPEHNSTSHGKDFKIHHSEVSRSHTMSNNSNGKQFDKTSNNKTSMSNEYRQMTLQVKEQRKQYLNRVAFKCTERESICLTKLDSASKKLSAEKKSGAYTPKPKDVEKPSMLEFKLCPDVLLKNTSSVDKQDDPEPEKEQAPRQVSGIKSTKEDWLKCIPSRTKMTESSQEADSTDSRLSKRRFSADEFEMLQNPVKGSSVMFRTYKKMYLEKRSRSLGSSPVK